MIKIGSSPLSKLYCNGDIKKTVLNGSVLYESAPAGTSLNYTINIYGYMFDCEEILCCFDNTDPEDSSLDYLDFDPQEMHSSGSISIQAAYVHVWQPFYIQVIRYLETIEYGVCEGTFNGNAITFTGYDSMSWISSALILQEGTNTLTITLQLND